MRKLTLKLYKNGKTKEELVINKDHVVTVRSFVDNTTEYKVVEILTISSIIRVTFYNYNRDENTTHLIDIDARNIIDIMLDEGDGCHLYELRSTEDNTIGLRHDIRC